MINDANSKNKMSEIYVEQLICGGIWFLELRRYLGLFTNSITLSGNVVFKSEVKFNIIYYYFFQMTIVFSM